MNRLRTKCKYCEKEYFINSDDRTQFKYIECCSQECINKYYLATGTGFNLTGQEVIFDGRRKIKDLLKEYKSIWERT